MEALLFLLASTVMGLGSVVLSGVQLLRGEPPTAIENVSLLAS